MWILGLKGLNQISRYVLDAEPANRRRISGRRLERSSLLADVLRGSFVTHSLWGRNECVTNEPQRTSAARLGEKRRPKIRLRFAGY